MYNLKDIPKRKACHLLTGENTRLVARSQTDPNAGTSGDVRPCVAHCMAGSWPFCLVGDERRALHIDDQQLNGNVNIGKKVTEG